MPGPEPTRPSNLLARTLGVLRSLLPPRFRGDIPVVPVVRLTGVIGFEHRRVPALENIQFVDRFPFPEQPFPRQPFDETAHGSYVDDFRPAQVGKKRSVFQ